MTAERLALTAPTRWQTIIATNSREKHAMERYRAHTYIVRSVRHNNHLNPCPYYASEATTPVPTRTIAMFA